MKIPVAVLFGIVFAIPFPSLYAHPQHETVVASAEDTSISAEWLRQSASGGLNLTGFVMDERKADRELSRLVERLRPAVAAAKGDREVVEAFRRVLLEEEGFRYDRVAGNPENFLAGGVLGRKRGNCLGLSLLWLSLAERLDVPFHGVHLPGHCFVRYEGNGERINVEFGEGGAAWSDRKYLEEFRLARKGPYLRSLSSAEMLGVFHQGLGAAYTKRGRHEEALAAYAEAERSHPGMPEVHYNAAVSLQNLERVDEAIAKYRKTLSLSPENALARGNLGLLLARQGKHAEAIEEARRAVEAEPWNAAARATLASTYCACEDYDRGILEYRRTLELDPSNARARAGLERAMLYREGIREEAKVPGRAETRGSVPDPPVSEIMGPHPDPRR